MSGRLTAKQRLFVAAYLKRLKAGQAYREVYTGASAATAETEGPALLRKPQIAAAVAEKLGKQLAKVDASAERVKQELARLAFIDATHAFDKKGRPLPLHQMPEDVRRAISGFEVDGAIRKVKFWSKPEALGLLAKHHGLLREIIEVADVTETREITNEEWNALSKLEHEVRGG